MPSITQHQSSKATKLLLLGDSGSGKTGALMSLAAAGYRLRILDMDNGCDVLKDLATNPKSPYFGKIKDLDAQVRYITITDKMKNVGGRAVPVEARAWPRMIEQMEKWKDPPGWQLPKPSKPLPPGSPEGRGSALAIVDPPIPQLDLGSIYDWGPEEVLVIDSLTFASNAAMNYILALNGRLGQRPQQGDWGEAQGLIEGLLGILYDGNVKCNVVMNCHISYMGEEGGPQRGFPNTLGKALPPKVGRYFNSMLMCRSMGAGAGAKRKIITNTTGLIDLKNTAPHRVAAEYPLESGLADYFKAVREG